MVITTALLKKRLLVYKYIFSDKHLSENYFQKHGQCQWNGNSAVILSSITDMTLNYLIMKLHVVMLSLLVP